MPSFIKIGSGVLAPWGVEIRLFPMHSAMAYNNSLGLPPKPWLVQKCNTLYITDPQNTHWAGHQERMQPPLTRKQLGTKMNGLDFEVRKSKVTARPNVLFQWRHTDESQWIRCQRPSTVYSLSYMFCEVTSFRSSVLKLFLAPVPETFYIPIQPLLYIKNPWFRCSKSPLLICRYICDSRQPEQKFELRTIIISCVVERRRFVVSWILYQWRMRMLGFVLGKIIVQL